tara:strand:- start:44 stop:850 length:807 start_codon:yes stop_codon:yes gene_type:complete
MNFKLLSEVNYNIETGNSVNLPHDVLEKLSSESKELPYFFEICTQSSLKSYVGVREFTADKDTIQIPLWLTNQLGLEGNQIITVTLLENVPKGKYVKIRPETENFFDVPEYESCLETQLSKFPLLYQGQTIDVEIFDKNYSIKIEEIEHDWQKFDFEKGTSSLELNVINVINTDINVDINNIFLRKKLEEQKKLEEIKRIEEERIAKERELQTTLVDLPVDNSSKSFQGEGNKLSDISSNNMSKASVREARLKFYQKDNKTYDKDMEV